MLSDCVNAIKYICTHKDELGIGNDTFVLNGDSAGGHLVLMLTMLHDSKKAKEALGLDVDDLDLSMTVACCPVYDFPKVVNIDMLNNSGRKRMFGPNALNQDYKMLNLDKEVIVYIPLLVHVRITQQKVILLYLLHY